MKKLLGMTLAAALVAPGLANAEILKNLKVDGSLDIQANAARNVADFSTRGTSAAGQGVVTGQDRIGSAVTRLLANLKWDLLDDVHAVVTLRKNDRAWGGAGGLGEGGNGSQAIGATGGSCTNPACNKFNSGGVLGNTWVDRAAITVDKLGGYVDTTLGRQYYGDQGDLVIYYGPTDDYGLFVSAIDAARFEIANDWMAFSGMAGKQFSAVGGTGAITPPTTDSNVRGFDILWKNLPIKAHTFVWNRVIQGAGQLGNPPGTGNATTGLNDNLWVYGVKLRGEAMGGWVSADLASNSGEDRTTLAGTACTALGCNAQTSNYIGKAFMFDGGYNAEMSGVGALTPWLNFGWGTGRSSNLEKHNEGFTSIASDYRPGIINRRFDGLVQGLGGGGSAPAGVNTSNLNNRVVYGAGLNFTPAAWEKLTFGAQIWSYNLQRVTATNAAPAAQRGAKHLGTEYGITADWKHSDNVMTGVGVAEYQPGGVVKQAIGSASASTENDPATLAFADFSVKF